MAAERRIGQAAGTRRGGIGPRELGHTRLGGVIVSGQQAHRQILVRPWPDAVRGEAFRGALSFADVRSPRKGRVGADLGVRLRFWRVMS
jgi:hypothetical protein